MPEQMKVLNDVGLEHLVEWLKREFAYKGENGSLEATGLTKAEVDSLFEEKQSAVEASVKTEGTYLGVNYQDCGMFAINGLTITGVANRITAFQFDGAGGNRTGWFLPLHLENCKMIKTVNHPDGIANDGTSDWLICLGEGAEPTFTTFTAVDNSDKEDVYTVSIMAAPFSNVVGASKWGFAKTSADLDTLIEAGQSSKIDHDSDIFFWKCPAEITDLHHVATIVKIGDKRYASFPGAAEEHLTGQLIGAGASTSGHATDFDFESSDGQTWTPCAAAPAIEGSASMEVRKYETAYNGSNGAEVLATKSISVLGPQVLNCAQSCGYNA